MDCGHLCPRTTAALYRLESGAPPQIGPFRLTTTGVKSASTGHAVGHTLPAQPKASALQGSKCRGVASQEGPS